MAAYFLGMLLAYTASSSFHCWPHACFQNINVSLIGRVEVSFGSLPLSPVPSSQEAASIGGQPQNGNYTESHLEAADLDALIQAELVTNVNELYPNGDFLQYNTKLSQQEKHAKRRARSLLAFNPMPWWVQQ